MICISLFSYVRPVVVRCMRVRLGMGWVGSMKIDPWTTLLQPVSQSVSGLSFHKVPGMTHKRNLGKFIHSRPDANLQKSILLPSYFNSISCGSPCRSHSKHCSLFRNLTNTAPYIQNYLNKQMSVAAPRRESSYKIYRIFTLYNGRRTRIAQNTKYVYSGTISL